MGMLFWEVTEDPDFTGKNFRENTSSERVFFVETKD
jgi:hypothetical protein